MDTLSEQSARRQAHMAETMAAVRAEAEDEEKERSRAYAYLERELQQQEQEKLEALRLRKRSLEQSMREVFRNMPPYAAEELLTSYINEAVVEAIVDEPADLSDHVPASFKFRRHPDYGPFPDRRPYSGTRTTQTLEVFYSLDLGFEAHPLGPVLEQLRLDLWSEWAECIDHGFDIDRDWRTDPAQLARLLIRRGLPGTGPPEKRLKLYDAVAALAASDELADLRHLPAHDAVEELVLWARANKHLREPEREKVRQIVRRERNRRLPPGEPTLQLAWLVRSVFPTLPGRQDRKTIRLRKAAVRLLARLREQLECWGDGRVGFPTAWFKPQRGRPQVIPGVSTKDYRTHLIVPLCDRGILKPLYRTTQDYLVYRLSLEIEGPPVSWEDVDAILEV